MPVRVVAMCGSLRRGSFNQSLLDTAIERAPAGMEIAQVDISRFPLFSQDFESDGFPPVVVDAKLRVRSSDCVLLVTPEYNFGVPGVLKNAVDCISRPPSDPTLLGRPMAVMGASGGYMGTVRAQLAWRQVWQFFKAPVFSQVELTVPFGRQAFESGRLVDPGRLEVLDAYLASLLEWLTTSVCK